MFQDHRQKKHDIEKLRRGFTASTKKKKKKKKKKKEKKKMAILSAGLRRVLLFLSFAEQQGQSGKVSKHGA